MKKALSFLLAMVLLLGAVSFAQAAEEPYHISFMYLGSAAEDQELVEAAVNELTLRELNMTVSLIPVTFANWQTQLQLMLPSGESLDIFPMWASNAATYIGSGYINDIGDLLDQYGDNIKACFGLNSYKVSQLNGFTFGVPAMKEFCNPSGFVMRTDILNELGIDPDTLKTWDDMDAVFAAVHEKYPNMVVLGGSKTNAPVTLYTSYDRLQDFFGVLENYGQTTTVTNWFVSEEYMQLAKKVREWYLAGYTLQDMATSTDRAESQVAAGNTFCFYTYLKPNSKVQEDQQCNYDMTCVYMTTPLRETCVMTTPSYAVGYTAKDPAKRVQFLDWAYGSKEFETLLNYGIEGKHWAYVDEANNIVDYPEGVDFANAGYHNSYGWALPNQEVSVLWVGNEPDVWESYVSFHDSAIVSQGFGFMYDTTEVTNELAMLNGIMDKYQYAIGSGSVDPEEYIPMFNAELTAGGIERVIECKQEQLNQWLASK